MFDMGHGENNEDGNLDDVEEEGIGGAETGTERFPKCSRQNDVVDNKKPQCQEQHAQS